MKSGRFKYQSGKAGDEAKKRKSPAKSGRVGIYALEIKRYANIFVIITIFVKVFFTISMLIL